MQQYDSIVAFGAVGFSVLETNHHTTRINGTRLNRTVYYKTQLFQPE